MAAGDQADMLQRLRNALPGGWFPDDAPILDAVLQGFAYGHARIFALLAFIKLQSRIATATGIWLDGIAADFFGFALIRRAGQSDAAMRSRIIAQLLAPKNTRQAVITALLSLTGRMPLVFEPALTSDTGGYELGGIGYGVAGGWGSLQLPFQAFVTAYRPHISGAVSGAGYGGPMGYGAGGGQYANLAQITGGVTDADIYQTIASVMPAAAVAWTRIEP